MFLPIMFKSDGMRCLLVGGGDVARRKLQILLSAGCDVTVIAPKIQNEIQASVDANHVAWFAREFHSGDCRGYQLVIAATGSPEVNRAIFDESESLGIPVNVVDDPELCTVEFPAIWKQGPLTISVGTEGRAPFMAAAVRDRIAVAGAPLARWVEIAARFRTAVRSEVSDPDQKNLLYRQFVDAIQSGNPPDPPETNELEDWIAWIGNLRRHSE